MTDRYWEQHPRSRTAPSSIPAGPSPAPAWLLWPFGLSTGWSIVLVGAVVFGFDPMKPLALIATIVISSVLIRGRRPRRNPTTQETTHVR